MGLGAVGGHVGVPTKGALALVLRGLQDGRRVGVLEQHVSAAVDQAGSGFGFFRWVEPLVDPHHLGLDLGVAALCAQGEAVDVADDFRDWHRGHHTEHIALGHLAGNHAGHVRALISAAVVGAHVVGGLVAGGVFELHVLEIRCQLEHGFHVAKGGAENQLVALACHVADDALCVGRLGHVFNKGRGDLVAEFFFQRLAGGVVRKGPTAVAHGADIGKGDLQRLGLGCRSGGSRRRRGHGSGLFLLAATHQGRTGHRGQCRQFQ